MIRQFREIGEPKINRDKKVGRPSTGSAKDAPAADTYPDEIDPADFFDPEEFGIRQPEPEKSRS